VYRQKDVEVSVSKIEEGAGTKECSFQKQGTILL
jgi:hypothetical protein